MSGTREYLELESNIGSESPQSSKRRVRKIDNCLSRQGTTNKLLRKEIIGCCGFVALIVIVAIVVLVKLHNSSTTPSKALEDVGNQAWGFYLASNPELASSIGNTSFDSVLSNLSITNLESQKTTYQNYLSKLMKIKKTKLSSDEQMNFDFLVDFLERNIYSISNQSYLLTVNQLMGPHINLPQLPQFSTFSSETDFTNYISRLNLIPSYIQETIDLLRIGMKNGMTTPRYIIPSVVTQINAILVTQNDYLDSPFASPFRKLQTTNKFYIQGLNAIKTSVIPAFQTFHNFIENEYQPACRTSIGAKDMPNGPAYYNWAIEFFTTTSFTAQQIHDTGLSEVARIRGNMQTIVNNANITGVSTISQFISYMRNSSQFYYSTETEFLQFIRDICKKADPQLPALFKTLPRCPYGVRAIPSNEAPTAPSAYYNPPSGGCSRPGYYNVNTYDLSQRPKYTYESVSLHESVPGHHLQFAIAREIEGIPDYRRFMDSNAFVEGWALYAESLGKDMGFYTDFFSDFGHLGGESLRACRLVVDTGIHYLGWSRNYSIDYMLENTPMSRLDIESEVDRYVVWPGQALGYKMGELKIQELRKKAQNELGNSFDVREFHDAVLGSGALPLDLLEQKINDFIAIQGIAK